MYRKTPLKIIHLPISISDIIFTHLLFNLSTVDALLRVHLHLHAHLKSTH